MRTSSVGSLWVLFALGALTSGCSNLEVTKRRHTPGYHVELGHKKKDVRQVSDKTDVAYRAKILNSNTREAAGLSAADGLSHSVERSEEVTVDAQMTSVSKQPPLDILEVNRAGQRVALADEFLLEPFWEIKREKIGKEFRSSVFPAEGDEKYGWSVVAIMSFGLGVVAFSMMFVAILWVITLGNLWFVPAIVAILFGIAALITGAIGLRKTRSGGKKGRGFALAGLISGIVAMVIGLVSLVIGAVRTFIDNRS